MNPNLASLRSCGTGVYQWQPNSHSPRFHPPALTGGQTRANRRLSWRFLFFATHDVAPTGMKLLEASNNTFVALVGPYYCPPVNADVMTIFEGVRRGQQMEGTFYTRVQNWRDTVRSGHFTATLADATTRAA